MDDALRERVEALERAVTDGDHDLSAFADEAEAVDRLETLESEVADLADRIEELEAATQALRGYVGNVRSVNTDVEQRADAALARVEALESRLPEDADGRGAAAEPPGDGAGHDSPQQDGPGHGDPQQNGSRDDTTQREDPEFDGAAGTVDEWEWGTDDNTGGTAGEHGDEPGRHGTEPGGAPAGNGRVTLGGAGRGHADAGRCSSCGRPRDANEISGSDRLSGAESDRPSGAGSDQPPDAGAPDTAAGQPTPNRDGQRVPVGGGGQPATGQASAGRGTTPGAPTVAAVAEHDPGGTDPEGSHGEDGDVLPDGADDPLVGTAGEDGGTGALQRIRDLL